MQVGRTQLVISTVMTCRFLKTVYDRGIFSICGVFRGGNHGPKVGAEIRDIEAMKASMGYEMGGLS